MLSKGELLPLPERNERLAGESTDNKDNYSISVSNAEGYLCHLTATCYFGATAEDVYAIFVNPDNTGVFRDIKTSGRREVLEEIPTGKGYRRTVEVEQLGEAKVLMFGTTFSTEVTVLEDDSDPQQLKTHFELKRSALKRMMRKLSDVQDILNRFHGNWLVTPTINAAGQVQGCKAVLNQEVLPRGVPAWLANAPVLGSALRGVVVRSAQRMIEDIEAILKQLNSTNDIHQVLRRAATKGHAKDAEKKAQAQRKQDKAQEASERKKSGVGGRFL